MIEKASGREKVNKKEDNRKVQNENLYFLAF